MSETLPGRPVVTTRPQADIYTVLLLVAIVCLAVTIGVVLYNLMSPVSAGGYGLSFGDLFKSTESIISGK
jgi:hypothetical protein